MSERTRPGSTSSTRLTDAELSMVRAAQEWVEQGVSPSAALLQPLTTGARIALDAALRLEPVAAAVRQASTALSATVVDVVGERAAAPLDACDVPSSVAARRDALALADGDTDRIRQRTVRQLGTRGAITGAASVNLAAMLVALASDVTSMTREQVRAAAEVLASYGVRDEGRTALATLVLAGETDPSRRHADLLAAAGFAGATSTRTGNLEDVLAEQTGARVATEAVERLIRARVRQRAIGVVPLLGAAAGAVTAGWMTARACETAQHVGRLHFLRVHAGMDAPLPRGTADGVAAGRPAVEGPSGSAPPVDDI